MTLPITIFLTSLFTAKMFPFCCTVSLNSSRITYVRKSIWRIAEEVFLSDTTTNYISTRELWWICKSWSDVRATQQRCFITTHSLAWSGNPNFQRLLVQLFLKRWENHLSFTGNFYFWTLSKFLFQLYTSPKLGDL